MRQFKDIPMKMVKCLFVLYLCVTSGAIYALENKHILTLTIINKTSDTLSYVGVKNMTPGNSYIVTPTDILPGGATTVTGTTTPYYDMTAQLRFKDNTGNVNLLSIKNHRHINYAQPSFSMHNESYISFVESKKLNRDESADAVMLNSATVVIRDKA